MPKLSQLRFTGIQVFVVVYIPSPACTVEQSLRLVSNDKRCCVFAEQMVQNHYCDSD